MNRFLSIIVLSLIACKAVECTDEETCQNNAEGENCQASPGYGEDGIAEDIKKFCPFTDGVLTNPVLGAVRLLGKPVGLLQKVGLWPAGVHADGWADDYTKIHYLIVARIALGVYKTRNKDYVKVPTEQSDPSDLVRVENIHAPHRDVDGAPNFFWFESIVPGFILRRVYVPLLTCFYSLLRRLNLDTALLNGTFSDAIDSDSFNTWPVVLKGTPYKTKYDWVKSFYDIANSWDGTPLWPKKMTNFQAYWKHDEWEDRLEYAMAFHLIGSHRVESGSWRFEGVPGLNVLELPFRIPLNVFASFEIRKHFGRYGGDLYFNQDGLPVLLETPDGARVTRGDKNWQYWKFVWRSTFITAITLVDHLHLTHFRVGNVLARLTRSVLPAKHPIRRMLSIFTFGTIFVNMQAMHTLIGPSHLLHRATPFKKFAELSQIVPSAGSGIIQDVPSRPGIKPLLDDQAWEKLHPMLKASPYFADGRLVMGAILKLASRLIHVSKDLLCDENDQLRPTARSMRSEIVNVTLAGNYKIDQKALDHLESKSSSCKAFLDIIIPRLASYIFVVTAYHRQVGFVGDYYLDPQLATMSWKDGEAFGRPRQHMLMTVINVFTSTKQPLLKEDYTHLFKGMEPDMEGDFVSLWRDFQKDLQDIEVEVDRRNEKREIKNINGSPKVLESAVSK